MKTRAGIVRGGLVACGLLAMSSGQAAVIGIDTTVTSPALALGDGPEANLQSFTAGGTTYNQLTFLGPATGLTNGTGNFARAGNPAPATTPEVAETLIGNASLTDGKANVSVADFALGQSVDPSDGWRFFMYELVLASGTTADDVVVRPLSGGSPVGDWTLTINPDDYGALTDPFNITLVTGTSYARGVTFTLNDFTGTGTLSGVDGLRFTDPAATATWDPVSVGVIVPEPAGFPLAGLGIGLAAWAARRRRSKA
jgi:hypothetical protein